MSTAAPETAAAPAARPETRSALEGQGFEPVTPTADIMRSTIASELDRNRRVIAAAGIVLE